MSIKYQQLSSSFSHIGTWNFYNQAIVNCVCSGKKYFNWQSCAFNCCRRLKTYSFEGVQYCIKTMQENILSAMNFRQIVLPIFFMITTSIVNFHKKRQINLSLKNIFLCFLWSIIFAICQIYLQFIHPIVNIIMLKL